MTRIVVGGYGPSLGVVDVVGGRFGEPTPVSDAENPSWVTVSADRTVVYAALENADGAVGAWRVADWEPLGTQPTQGADPCHLALSPDGCHLVASNYSSGSVCVLPVRDDGSLAAATEVVQHEGVPGPVADRQDGPHAHQAVFVDPTRVLVCDLGLDVVIGYEFDPTSGSLTERHRTAFPPGTGPRHLVVAGRDAYVLGELSSTLTRCEIDGYALLPGQSVSTRPGGEIGPNLPAAVILDGGDVVVTNRGDDTVCAWSPTRDGLTLVRGGSSGGAWPRWAGVVDGRLLVADERSDRLVVLEPVGEGWILVDSASWSAPAGVAVLQE